MQIIKWEPLKEIDRFFDDRFLQPVTSFLKFGADLAIDLYEEKGGIIAKMSLPGIKTEELDISLKDDILTISGKREEEKETDKKDYYSKEIRRGSFSRSVYLPKTVDASKTQAKCENGELIVTMPVVADAKNKEVKVKIQGSH